MLIRFFAESESGFCLVSGCGDNWAEAYASALAIASGQLSGEISLTEVFIF